jgi:prevent-host-death family protein
MGTVTVKQLHLKTKSVLDQLEKGEHLVVTRNGRPVARLEPLSQSQPPRWDDVMKDVWHAQKRIKSGERVANPVLEERQRRRR